MRCAARDMTWSGQRVGKTYEEALMYSCVPSLSGAPAPWSSTSPEISRARSSRAKRDATSTLYLLLSVAIVLHLREYTAWFIPQERVLTEALLPRNAIACRCWAGDAARPLGLEPSFTSSFHSFLSYSGSSTSMGE